MAQVTRAGSTLELVCYPYLRKQLKSTRRRAYFGNVFARIKTNSDIDAGLYSKLEEHQLANKFFDFQEWQDRVKTFSMSHGQGKMIFGDVDILVSPTQNGRPPMKGAPIAYDSQEYEQHVAAEKQGAEGDLRRLPSLHPHVCHNLRAFLAQPHLFDKNLKSPHLAHYLHSGSAEYAWDSWDHEAGASTVDTEEGWRSLDNIKLNDTLFFTAGTALHAGVYLGGKMVLHKTSSDGPVWISTLREVLEMAGWNHVRVRSSFKGGANRFVPEGGFTDYTMPTEEELSAMLVSKAHTKVYKQQESSLGETEEEPDLPEEELPLEESFSASPSESEPSSPSAPQPAEDTQTLQDLINENAKTEAPTEPPATAENAEVKAEIAALELRLKEAVNNEEFEQCSMIKGEITALKAALNQPPLDVAAMEEVAQQITAQMKQAVADEHYEKAASLRDAERELRKLLADFEEAPVGQKAAIAAEAESALAAARKLI